MVKEFTDSASKPGNLQNVVFATINKTRQSSGSTARAVHAGGCCTSTPTDSCCTSQAAEKNCCSTSSPESSGCCQSADTKGKSKACACTDSTPPPRNEEPKGEGSPADTATTQLDALRFSQQPESLRTTAFPDGLRMQDCTIFYVGEETRGLVNLMMENADNRVRSFFPSFHELV
jgi:hypothetical protein